MKMMNIGLINLKHICYICFKKLFLLLAHLFERKQRNLFFHLRFN